jgi:hypothetical protein
MLSLQYMALSMARVAAGGCAEEATACLRLAPMLRVGGKEGGIGHAICAFSAVTELSDVKSVCGSRKTAWRVAIFAFVLLSLRGPSKQKYTRACRRATTGPADGPLSANSVKRAMKTRAHVRSHPRAGAARGGYGTS